MVKQYFTEKGELATVDSEKVYMSKAGYEEAKKHLKYLQTTKRDEIVQRIAEARGHGDLSENAEYDAARNEQAANEGEIIELEYKLKNREIYATPSSVDFITFGVKVTVYDEDFEEEEVYEITGTLEADADAGKISNESPVGEALIGHKTGEKVTVTLANGNEFELLVKNIELA